MKLLPEHVAGARAMLKMTQEELASLANVAPKTIGDFEKGLRQLRPENEVAIRAVLEARSARFANGDKPTVTIVLGQTDADDRNGEPG